MVLAIRLSAAEDRRYRDKIFADSFQTLPPMKLIIGGLLRKPNMHKVRIAVGPEKSRDRSLSPIFEKK